MEFINTIMFVGFCVWLIVNGIYYGYIKNDEDKHIKQLRKLNKLKKNYDNRICITKQRRPNT